MKYLRILLLIMIILIPTFFPLTNVVTSKINKPLKNFIYDLRGIDVIFDPPEIILDCGSKFTLDVTLINNRNFPRRFSVIVFMNLTDEKSILHCQRIGNVPFVHLQPKESKTIQITCLTLNNLNENIN